MPEEIRETPTIPPTEGSKKVLKSEAVTPVPKPDLLLDRLQSEAARARGAKQSGGSGSSHT